MARCCGIKIVLEMDGFSTTLSELGLNDNILSALFCFIF